MLGGSMPLPLGRFAEHGQGDRRRRRVICGGGPHRASFFRLRGHRRHRARWDCLLVRLEELVGRGWRATRGRSRASRRAEVATASTRSAWAWPTARPDCGRASDFGERGCHRAGKGSTPWRVVGSPGTLRATPASLRSSFSPARHRLAQRAPVDGSANRFPRRPYLLVRRAVPGSVQRVDHPSPPGGKRGREVHIRPCQGPT